MSWTPSLLIAGSTVEACWRGGSSASVRDRRHMVFHGSTTEMPPAASSVLDPGEPWDDGIEPRESCRLERFGGVRCWRLTSTRRPASHGTATGTRQVPFPPDAAAHRESQRAA